MPGNVRELPDTLGVGSGALEGSRSKLSAEESAEGNEREKREIHGTECKADGTACVAAQRQESTRSSHGSGRKVKEYVAGSCAGAKLCSAWVPMSRGRGLVWRWWSSRKGIKQDSLRGRFLF